jgi:membrane-bound lytic murein transglycosylase B
MKKSLFAVLFIALSVGAGSVEAQEKERFLKWLTAFTAEAEAKGIRAETLVVSLDGVQLIPRVIELDLSQPEFTLTFEEYLSRVVPDSRVERARRLYAAHRPILDEIGKKFGVQPRFIVALWGIESDFGRLTGGFAVVPALVTLAFDGRRSSYFRSELLSALRIIDAGHITADRMKGSWAGAMGQSQFMPSSFLNFAYDHDGDGRKDIWTTLPDVFASTANYLSRSGWRGDESSAGRVIVPEGLGASLEGLDNSKPVNAWQALGVRRPDGADLLVADIPASLLRPAGADGPTYLVYNNYRAILRWNRSHYFAIAVGQLADSIIGL